MILCTLLCMRAHSAIMFVKINSLIHIGAYLATAMFFFYIAIYLISPISDFHNTSIISHLRAQHYLHLFKKEWNCDRQGKKEITVSFTPPSWSNVIFRMFTILAIRLLLPVTQWWCVLVKKTDTGWMIQARVLWLFGVRYCAAWSDGTLNCCCQKC